MIEPGEAPSNDRVERRGGRLTLIVGFALAGLLGVAVWWAASLGPRIKVPQGVPADVSEIVDRTWPVFLDTFPARTGCIGDVTLLLVFDVEGGAAVYAPDNATIRIEIPTTPERFEESLVHELGHHLEHRCDPVESIGDAFVAAEGLDPETAWFDRDRWFEAPTEHFAEAVVQLTLGERRIHADRFTVRDASLRLVADWGRDASDSAKP